MRGMRSSQAAQSKGDGYMNNLNLKNLNFALKKLVIIEQRKENSMQVRNFC